MLHAYIYSLGCTENLLDAQRYHDFLQQNGYIITEAVEDADIVLFVTCGVTTYIANECEEKYTFMKSRLKQGAKIITCGCLPVIEKERVSRFDTVTFKSSHGDVTKLAEILGLEDYNWDETALGHQFYIGPGNSNEAKNLQGAVATAVGKLRKLVDIECEMENVFNKLGLDRPMYFRRISEEVYREAYFVHVSRGCSGNCSYCAVKFVKGDIQSKPVEQIVKEVKIGYEKGKTEIVLAGDDVGSYGKDIGQDFYSLMSELNALNLPVNYTIRNFEPFWMINNLGKMEKLIEGSNIVSVCVPIQSGSNAILTRMKRPYKVEQVLGAVGYLKDRFPHVVFSTHYMVGFPGETDEDFDKTLKSMKSKYFDFIRYSMYTDRPNTESSKMENKVPVLEKLRKMKIIEETACEIFEDKQKEVADNWISTLNYNIGSIFNG